MSLLKSPDFYKSIRAALEPTSNSKIMNEVEIRVLRVTKNVFADVFNRLMLHEKNYHPESKVKHSISISQEITRGQRDRVEIFFEKTEDLVKFARAYHDDNHLAVALNACGITEAESQIEQTGHYVSISKSEHNSERYGPLKIAIGTEAHLDKISIDDSGKKMFRIKLRKRFRYVNDGEHFVDMTIIKEKDGRIFAEEYSRMREGYEIEFELSPKFIDAGKKMQFAKRIDDFISNALTLVFKIPNYQPDFRPNPPIRAQLKPHQDASLRPADLKKYVASIKINGTFGHLILNAGGIYVHVEYGRDNVYGRIGEPSQSFAGGQIVIEGEYVIEPKQRSFCCFDMIDDGEPNYLERLKNMWKIISEINKSKLDMKVIQKRVFTFDEHIDDYGSIYEAIKTLRVGVESAADVSTAFSFAAKQEEGRMPQDGFILTAIGDPEADIIKWKPPDENTVDLRITFERNGEYKVYSRKGQDPLLIDIDRPIFQYAGGLPTALSDEIVTNGDIVEFIAVNIRDKKEYSERVQLLLPEAATNDICLVANRVRYDKFAPNDIRTFSKCTDDAKSINARPQRQIINREKWRTIKQTIMIIRKRISKEIRALDIATGRGADIEMGYFAERGVGELLCTDIDISSLKTIYYRYQGRPFFKRLKFAIADMTTPFVAEDHRIKLAKLDPAILSDEPIVKYKSLRALLGMYRNFYIGDSAEPTMTYDKAALIKFDKEEDLDEILPRSALFELARETEDGEVGGESDIVISFLKTIDLETIYVIESGIPMANFDLIGIHYGVQYAFESREKFAALIANVKSRLTPASGICITAPLDKNISAIFGDRIAKVACEGGFTPSNEKMVEFRHPESVWSLQYGDVTPYPAGTHDELIFGRKTKFYYRSYNKFVEDDEETTEYVVNFERLKAEFADYGKLYESNFMQNADHDDYTKTMSTIKILSSGLIPAREAKAERPAQLAKVRARLIENLSKKYAKETNDEGRRDFIINRINPEAEVKLGLTYRNFKSYITALAAEDRDLLDAEVAEL